MTQLFCERLQKHRAVIAWNQDKLVRLRKQVDRLQLECVTDEAFDPNAVAEELARFSTVLTALINSLDQGCNLKLGRNPYCQPSKETELDDK